MILVATLSNPKTSLGFIDRFLVSAETFRIPAILVINKLDSYTASELKMASQLQSMYQQIGYQTILTSFTNKQGIETQFVKQEKLKNVAFPIRIYEVVTAHKTDSKLSSKESLKEVSEKRGGRVEGFSHASCSRKLTNMATVCSEQQSFFLLCIRVRFLREWIDTFSRICILNEINDVPLLTIVFSYSRVLFCSTLVLHFERINPPRTVRRSW